MGVLHRNRVVVVFKPDARKRRTKVDWAVEVAHLLDTRYASCQKITLVCDNLNTHTTRAFYEVFAPDIARASVKCIDFCTPKKHGSWLRLSNEHRAECELTLLQSEIKIWVDKTNAKQRGVDWQFPITDARAKRKRLSPVIKTG